jgi:hypothetical protein
MMACRFAYFLFEFAIISAPKMRATLVGIPAIAPKIAQAILELSIFNYMKYGKPYYCQSGGISEPPRKIVFCIRAGHKLILHAETSGVFCLMSKLHRSLHFGNSLS